VLGVDGWVQGEASRVNSRGLSPLFLRRRTQSSTFAVNAALVASQWQHRASTVPLYPPINVMYRSLVPIYQRSTRLDRKYLFMSWVWTGRESIPTSPALSQPAAHLNPVHMCHNKK